jgi:tRNA threonylcarbamoyladenosine modification (KEOPS) complex  Pcc1 subunit
MRAKAFVRLPLDSEKQLSALANALAPEIDQQISSRSNTSLTREGPNLILKMEARDTVALRAALNAYLRWINSIINVLEKVEKEEK